jgi:hypothetical protein
MEFLKIASERAKAIKQLVREGENVQRAGAMVDQAVMSGVAESDILSHIKANPNVYKGALTPSEAREAAIAMHSSGAPGAPGVAGAPGATPAGAPGATPAGAPGAAPAGAPGATPTGARATARAMQETGLAVRAPSPMESRSAAKAAVEGGHFSRHGLKYGLGAAALGLGALAYNYNND